jgi:glycosyltransferase involved in cell wall biosynthesis
VANLVEHLPGVEVFIFTRNTDYCSATPYADIVSDTWTAVSATDAVYYASPKSLHKQVVGRLLNEINPSVVYISGVYSKVFNIWVQQLALQQGLPCVVAARGMLSPHSTSVKPLKKALFLAYMRIMRGYAKVHFHATSSQEAQDIKRVVGTHKAVTVIPNLPRRLPSALPPIKKQPGLLKLIMLSRVAPEKGTLEGILSLQQAQGVVSLFIYGTCYDQAYWQQCKKAIDVLPATCKVAYNGTLDPDSPSFVAAINDAHALLMPSAGENYGHSIVECLSQGKPVIISHHTPWQGLEANKAGFNLNPNEFEKGVTSLLQMDQSNYNEWSRGALCYFNEHIAAKNDKNLQQYHSLFTRG